MKRRGALILGIAGAATAAALAALALAGRGGGAHDPFAVSASGTPVPSSGLAATDTRALAASGAGSDVRLLATRGATSFYKILDSSGNACYAVGSPTAGVRFHAVFCGSPGASDAFPSAARPLLMFPAGEVDASGARVVTGLWGLAADKVARVEIALPDGSSRSAPVKGNVFAFGMTKAPAGSEIVARDASGAVIVRQPLLMSAQS
jgi:hypothetical protein